jgi:hypothetical protein
MGPEVVMGTAPDGVPERCLSLGTEMDLSAQIGDKRTQFADIASSSADSGKPWNCGTFEAVRGFLVHD